ncbi:MAG: hypothetical protein IKN87_00395 [Bacilli bacterium]|nr:hypothetical protein [Bacilli bacterium]
MISSSIASGIFAIISGLILTLYSFICGISPTVAAACLAVNFVSKAFNRFISNSLSITSVSNSFLISIIVPPYLGIII